MTAIPSIYDTIQELPSIPVDLLPFHIDQRNTLGTKPSDNPILIYNVDGNSIELKFVGKGSIVYREKSILYDGVFRGYILRKVCADYIEIEHPSHKYIVKVLIDNYNKKIANNYSDSKIDISTKHVLRLIEDIADITRKLYNEENISDVEFHDVREFMKTILFDIRKLQSDTQIIGLETSKKLMSAVV